MKNNKIIQLLDGTENADRKRQRLNSEQDEGQSTSNDNETENREDVEQGWAPRRRLRGPRGTRTPLTESEPSPDESNEPAAEVNGKISIHHLDNLGRVFFSK